MRFAPISLTILTWIHFLPSFAFAGLPAILSDISIGMPFSLEGEPDTQSGKNNSNLKLVVVAERKTFTPSDLEKATLADDAELVEKILRSGVDPNFQNANGDSVLLLASKRGHAEIVKLILKSGVDVNATNNIGQTAMHLASFYGGEKIIKLLVDNGGNVNAISKSGLTPLNQAQNLKTAQLLVDNGAKVDLQGGTNGMTALMAFSLHYDLEMVKYLVSKGADIRMKSDSGGTALIFAARGGKLDNLKFLLKNKAEVNHANDEGKTALMEALETRRGKNFEMMEALMEAGADPELKDHKGYSAFNVQGGLYKAELQYLMVVRDLKLGMNVNHRLEGDENGNTLLMRAADSDNFKLVKFLVENGANINMQNSWGFTAFMGTPNYEIVEYLLANGANLKIKDNEGYTALDIAKARKGGVSGPSYSELIPLFKKAMKENK